MHLKLDYLEIENKQLIDVFWNIGNELHFRGVALENDGKRICGELSKFKKDQIVEVEAETSDYDLFEGVCKIVKIEIPPPNVEKAPVLFRFSGILKRVF